MKAAPTKAHDTVTVTDPDGREVIGVRLTNRPLERAWLYASDYRRIIAEMGHAAWYANSNGQGRWYVRLQSPHRGTPAMLSRLVAGDFPRTFVKHRDGNWLNFRQSNLELEHGSGGCAKKRRLRHAA